MAEILRSRPKKERALHLLRGGTAVAIVAAVALGPLAGCTKAENNDNHQRVTSPRIALVDFGNLSQAQETDIKNEINVLVMQATQTIVSPQLTFIDASQAAQDTFANFGTITQHPDCTDDRLTKSFAATAADGLMESELKSYDTIVAFSPLPFCDEGVAGSTDFTNKRHVDVSLHPSGDIGNDTPGRTAAHEIMHTLGWGHEGEFRQPENNHFLELTNDISFDMINYLSRARYFSNGDGSNLMGFFPYEGQITDLPQIDPIQIDMLRATIGDASRAGVSVEKGTTQTINQDPNNRPYALITLDQVLQIGSSATDPDPFKYNQVAFIPHWADGKIDSIMVSIIDTRDGYNQITDVVSFGPDTNQTAGAENTWSVKIFNQEIKLAVDNNALSVTN